MSVELPLPRTLKFKMPPNQNVCVVSVCAAQADVMCPPLSLLRRRAKCRAAYIYIYVIPEVGQWRQESRVKAVLRYMA